MGRIPEAVIDEVLTRADILQTVRDYVSLKRSGQNYKGLCPFHNENTPSFNVHPGKGIFKCFGCQEGGNVISFVMKIEGWSFPEAVRQLADRYGVEVPEESDEDQEAARRRREGKKLYLNIMEMARSFYEENLWGDDGAAARHYLSERDIDRETAETFGLGFAPKGWQNLLDHLKESDISGKLAERAGLALQRKGGDGYYDRFRHRVVFPIVDIWGNTLAFGGRVIAADDDSPKYINSPETTYYTKGRQLYGLYVAKQHIQKADYALLVEGNFDVIALHAAGVQTAVAPMGTAVTDAQAKLLARYCRQVVVAFDGDEAGREAAVKCLSALEKAGIDARVIVFEDGEDPDVFVRRHGADALEEMVDDAKDLVLWALERVLPTAERGDVRDNVNALEEAARILTDVQSDVARDQYVQEIARWLAIEPRLVNDYIERPNTVGEKIKRAVAAAHEPLQLEKVEFGLLVVLLDHLEWLDGFLAEEYDNLLSSEELADFLGRAQAYYEEHERFDAPVVLERIENRAFRKTVEDALLASEELYSSDKSRQFYDDCVRTLKRRWAERTLGELERRLEHLDFSQERDEYESVFRQMQEVQQFREGLR